MVHIFHLERRIAMRTIGLDLATKGQHKAALGDASGKVIRRNIKVKTRAAALERLFNQARGRGGADEPLRLMTEPTGMVWHAVCVYTQKRGVTPYLVSTNKVHDLREYYKALQERPGGRRRLGQDPLRG